MAVQLFNLAGMACSATGTNTLTLTSALPGFSSLADAGVTDGDEVRYLIKDGNNRELGTGTYTASGVTVSRDTVLQSISGGVTGMGKISLSGTSEVYLTLAAEDLSNLVSFADTFTLPTTDGTTGQVLQTNGSGVLSFADAGGGGGGLVPIGKTTASASAAIDIALTGGYSAYMVRLDKVKTANDAAVAVLRTSTDGGSSFSSGASDYAYTILQINTSAAHSDASGASYVLLGQSIGNDIGEHIDGNIFIYVGGTSFPRIMFDLACQISTGLSYRAVGVGHRASGTAIDAIRIYMLAGNITSGDFHLYGIADGA